MRGSFFANDMSDMHETSYENKRFKISKIKHKLIKIHYNNIHGFRNRRVWMKSKILWCVIPLVVTGAWAGNGKVRIASDANGAFVYVDGKKKAMIGEGVHLYLAR